MSSRKSPHFNNFKFPSTKKLFQLKSHPSEMESTNKSGTTLEMRANDSTGFADAIKNQKMCTKRDGRQQPFSQEKLAQSLAKACGGLDMNYINLDIITGKV